MEASVAASVGHARHDDWEDRFSKIDDLVSSAQMKADAPLMSDEALEQLAKVQPIMDVEGLTATVRPIGPQRQPTAADIEKVVEARDDTKDVYETFTAQSLHAETLPPVDWLIPNVLPKGGMVSLAGASNVGKTRWLAGVVMSAAAGRVEYMGLPGLARL